MGGRNSGDGGGVEFTMVRVVERVLRCRSHFLLGS